MHSQLWHMVQSKSCLLPLHQHLARCAPNVRITTARTFSTRQQSLSLRVTTTSERATEELAALCAASGLKPGDIILMRGQVGSGKTVFSRGLIRSLSKEPDLVVPSPSFSLSQEYLIKLDKLEQHPPKDASLPFGKPSVQRNPFHCQEECQENKNVNGERIANTGMREIELHHLDMYRLESVTETEWKALDLGHTFAKYISVIEWPEKLIPLMEAHGYDEWLGIKVSTLRSSHGKLNFGGNSDPQFEDRTVSFVAKGNRWNEYVEKLHGLVDSSGYEHQIS